ncbi:hypothetical protein, partial [Mycobacterium marinum]
TQPQFAPDPAPSSPQGPVGGGFSPPS